MPGPGRNTHQPSRGIETVTENHIERQILRRNTHQPSRGIETMEIQGVQRSVRSVGIPINPVAGLKL